MRTPEVTSRDGTRPPAKDCGSDRWPRWVPLGVGALTLALALAVVLQRRLLVSPDPALVLVLLATAPCLLDAARVLTHRDLGESRLALTPWLMPLLCGAVVLGSSLTLMLVYPTATDFAPFFLVMLAGTLAAQAGPWVGAAVGAAGALSLVGLELASTFIGSAIWTFAIAVSWLAGTGLRRQLRVLDQLEAAQADLAGRAAAEERQRLAREIHDLVAHSLAVTMLHLTGARLALKDHDTDEALQALAQAEEIGREAMAEIRRTVGLLGPPGDSGAAAPTPGVADLPGLVHDVRAAGLDVQMDVEGDLSAVPLASGIALYRIVRESLSNAVRHAPGSAVHLAVAAGPTVVRASIENPLPPYATSGLEPEASSHRGRAPGGHTTPATGEGGHGIRGMTERAQLLGGTLRAEPLGDSWVVTVAIPLDGPVAAPHRATATAPHRSPATDPARHTVAPAVDTGP